MATKKETTAMVNAETGEIMTTAAKDVSKLSLDEKLALASAEIPKLGKDLHIEGEGKAYDALSFGQVMEIVKAVCAKYRMRIKFDEEFISENLISMRKGETTYQITKKVTLSVVNIDNPAQVDTSSVIAYGLDAYDKAAGTASTYGKKYALIAEFNIESADKGSLDPDVAPSKPKTSTSDVKPASTAPDKVVSDTGSSQVAATAMDVKTEKLNEAIAAVSASDVPKEAPKAKTMTLEEAKSLVYTGANKEISGKTFGEVLDTEVGARMIAFFAEHPSEGHPEYNTAARLILGLKAA